MCMTACNAPRSSRRAPRLRSSAHSSRTSSICGARLPAKPGYRRTEAERYVTAAAEASASPPRPGILNQAVRHGAVEEERAELGLQRLIDRVVILQECRQTQELEAAGGERLIILNHLERRFERHIVDFKDERVRLLRRHRTPDIAVVDQNRRIVFE